MKKNLLTQTACRHIALAAIVLTPFLKSNARQLEVTTEKEGTLATLISEDDKWSVTELKISGPVNAFDLRTIREMCGADLYGAPTEGKVEILDLSDVIIKGYDENNYQEEQYYYMNPTNLVVYVIGEDNKLTQSMFIYCNSLKELIVPKAAFCPSGLRGMDNLEKISASPESEHLSVSDNILYSKDKSALIYCPPLNPDISDFTTPQETKEIIGGAFLSTKNLTSFNATNVVKIGGDAISNCPQIRKITFGDALESYSNYAIFANPELEEISVSDNNKALTFDNGALMSKGKDSLYLYLGKDESYSVPDGVKTIDTGAFFIRPLKYLSLPNSVTKLNHYALYSCKNLEIINIGTGLEKIDDLTVVELPSLKQYNIDKNNPYFTSIDGAIYTADRKALISVPGGLEEFSIAEGTDSIAYMAFNYMNSKIRKITLPKSIRAVMLATYYSPNLMEIYAKAENTPEFGQPFVYANFPEELVLYVPIGKEEKYRESFCFSYIKNIKEFDYSSISHNTTDTDALKEIAIYSIDGRLLPERQKGINIIKMSDGSTQKVIVR